MPFNRADQIIRWPVTFSSHLIRRDCGMSKTYREWSPDQVYMFPPSSRDWLPESDLVYFMIDTVATLDLTPICAHYERELRGPPPFHPRMMVALLLYCYATGTRSSRKIIAAVRPTSPAGSSSARTFLTFARSATSQDPPGSVGDQGQRAILCSWQSVTFCAGQFVCIPFSVMLLSSTIRERARTPTFLDSAARGRPGVWGGSSSSVPSS